MKTAGVAAAHSAQREVGGEFAMLAREAEGFDGFFDGLIN